MKKTITFILWITMLWGALETTAGVLTPAWQQRRPYPYKYELLDGQMHYYQVDSVFSCKSATNTPVQLSFSLVDQKGCVGMLQLDLFSFDKGIAALSSQIAQNDKKGQDTEQILSLRLSNGAVLSGEIVVANDSQDPSLIFDKNGSLQLFISLISLSDTRKGKLGSPMWEHHGTIVSLLRSYNITHIQLGEISFSLDNFRSAPTLHAIFTELADKTGETKKYGRRLSLNPTGK